MSDPLSALPNIGAVLEEQLNRAGVRTPEMLRALGSREAWLKVRGIDPRACLHKLQALEGAIRGVRKNQLPQSVKDELRVFFERYRQGGE